MGNIPVTTTTNLYQEMSQATTSDAATVEIVKSAAIVIATTVVEGTTITAVVSVAVKLGPAIKGGAGWKIILPQDTIIIILQNTIILVVVFHQKMVTSGTHLLGTTHYMIMVLVMKEQAEMQIHLFQFLKTANQSATQRTRATNMFYYYD